MPNTDPFSRAYDAVWLAITGFKPLSDMVGLGNMIRFDGTRRDDPEKTEAQDGDMPELKLMPAGIQIIPFATSSSSRATMTLELQLNTQDMRIGGAGNLYPLTWALLGALLAAGVTLGEREITSFEVEGFTQTTSDTEANRDTKGWTASANINIEMMFANDQSGSSRGIK